MSAQVVARAGLGIILAFLEASYPASPPKPNGSQAFLGSFGRAASSQGVPQHVDSTSQHQARCLNSSLVYTALQFLELSACR